MSPIRKEDVPGVLSELLELRTNFVVEDFERLFSRIDRSPREVLSKAFIELVNALIKQKKFVVNAEKTLEEPCYELGIYLNGEELYLIGIWSGSRYVVTNIPYDTDFLDSSLAEEVQTLVETAFVSNKPTSAFLTIRSSLA